MRCLDHSDECAGPVEMHTVGDRLKAFPRCDHHYLSRLRRYDESLERYATSDVAPPGFDPTAIGERWDEDD